MPYYPQVRPSSFPTQKRPSNGCSATRPTEFKVYHVVWVQIPMDARSTFVLKRRSFSFGIDISERLCESIVAYLSQTQFLKKDNRCAGAGERDNAPFDSGTVGAALKALHSRRRFSEVWAPVKNGTRSFQTGNVLRKRHTLTAVLSLRGVRYPYGSC